MYSQALRDARRYEELFEKNIPLEQRPVFHLTPRTGWLNDPNGFSYYKGQFHIFYQYNPYASQWDSMHWGHAVSTDLIHWKALPCALAPDKAYDYSGCFSGDAIEMDDGRMALIYTGTLVKGGNDGKQIQVQTQNIAFGDGQDFEKYEKNPVLTVDDLPDGFSEEDFRDPKIWKNADGEYVCLVSAKGADGNGNILLFKSDDCRHWTYFSTLIRNDGTFGRMWECPDMFPLDGEWIILVSPMDMMPKGFEYHNGNGTLCLIGSYDEKTGSFTPKSDQAIDYGIDFYATQTVKAPDGRTIMIGWLQNWDAIAVRDKDALWAGQLSVPREIFIKDDRLYQRPIREIEFLRNGKVEYKDVPVKEGMKLPGISGRVADIELTVRAAEGSDMYEKFAMWFAEKGNLHTSLRFRPHDGTLKIDRKFSGSRRAIIHQRRCYVGSHDGTLHIRILLDRFSAEIFVNDGEKVMSVTLYTDPAADGISFHSDGDVIMDITKFELKI